jgi:hypothetical protein
MDIELPRLTNTTRYKVWKAVDQEDAYFTARRIYVRRPQSKRQWTGFMVYGETVQRIPDMEVDGKKVYQELPPETTYMATKIGAPLYASREEAIQEANALNAKIKRWVPKSRRNAV